MILDLSLSKYELDGLLLETGKQPNGIFTIILHKQGEF
jgi:hypothetical protein